MVVSQTELRSTSFSKDTLAVVMAGGSGSRLGDLTRSCAKPSIPFGGKYRTIDFVLSNCLHSNIRRIGVLTQYKAHTLIKHLQCGWQFLHHELGEFIDIWPAQQQLDHNWYAGTADAVYQNLDIIEQSAPRYVIVLAGDHIYKMNYEAMIRQHAESGASVTVGAIEVPARKASEFGIMSVERDLKVIAFEEKPGVPITLPNRPDHALASMGIYVFSLATLKNVLTSDAVNEASTHDFGRDIIPSLLKSARVMAYPFLDKHGRSHYWQDIGTLESFWQANMDALNPASGLNLHDSNWPIWTSELQLPPAEFHVSGSLQSVTVTDSLTADGCVVTGSTIQHSILSSNVTVASGCEITDSVILPNAKIGRGCRLHRVVVDSDCEVPDGTVIGYEGVDNTQQSPASGGKIVLVTSSILQSLFAVDNQCQVA